MEQAKYKLLKYNEQMSTTNGVFGIVAANLILPFISLYAIEVMDASDNQIALMDSLSGLAGIIALIPGALWLNRLERKKVFTGMSILLGRLFLVALALVPLFPAHKAMWLVVLFALMNIPNSTANLSWQTFIADIIPEGERSKYFSDRNRIIKIVGLGVTLATGYVLNHFSKNNPLPYQLLFFVSFIFGILEVYFLFRHREPKWKEKKEREVNRQQITLRLIKEMLFEQKNYSLFLLSSVVFYFGWQMAWPLFKIYNVRYAEATAGWLSAFDVLNGIVWILTVRWWGRFADVRGNGFATVVAALGIASVPVLTALSTNLVYLAAVNLFTGTFVAGITLILFNRLLEVTPTKNRSSYIALYQLAIGVSAIISPQVGVWVLGHFSIQTAFYTSGFFRFIGALAFAAVFWMLKRQKLEKTQAPR